MLFRLVEMGGMSHESLSIFVRLALKKMGSNEPTTLASPSLVSVAGHPSWFVVLDKHHCGRFVARASKAVCSLPSPH